MGDWENGNMFEGYLEVLFRIFILYKLSVAGLVGGALTLERGMGMCRGHDPLFSDQSPLPSLPIYCQCTTLVPLVFNFQKIFAFSAMFWPKF